MCAKKTGSIEDLAVVGVDIGKDTFHLVGFDRSGQVVLRKQIKRLALDATFEKLPRCVVGMEACLSAHFVSRRLRDSHTSRLQHAPEPPSSGGRTIAALCQARLDRSSIGFWPPGFATSAKACRHSRAGKTRGGEGGASASSGQISANAACMPCPAKSKDTP